MVVIFFSFLPNLSVFFNKIISKINISISLDTLSGDSLNICQSFDGMYKAKLVLNSFWDRIYVIIDTKAAKNHKSLMQTDNFRKLFRQTLGFWDGMQLNIIEFYHKLWHTNIEKIWHKWSYFTPIGIDIQYFYFVLEGMFKSSLHTRLFFTTVVVLLLAVIWQLYGCY